MNFHLNDEDQESTDRQLLVVLWRRYFKKRMWKRLFLSIYWQRHERNRLSSLCSRAAATGGQGAFATQSILFKTRNSNFDWKLKPFKMFRRGRSEEPELCSRTPIQLQVKNSKPCLISETFITSVSGLDGCAWSRSPGIKKDFRKWNFSKTTSEIRRETSSDRRHGQKQQSCGQTER